MQVHQSVQPERFELRSDLSVAKFGAVFQALIGLCFIIAPAFMICAMLWKIIDSGQRPLSHMLQQSDAPFLMGAILLVSAVSFCTGGLLIALARSRIHRAKKGDPWLVFTYEGIEIPQKKGKSIAFNWTKLRYYNDMSREASEGVHLEAFQYSEGFHFGSSLRIHYEDDTGKLIRVKVKEHSISLKHLITAKDYVIAFAPDNAKVFLNSPSNWRAAASLQTAHGKTD